jgi:predicted porin
MNKGVTRFSLAALTALCMGVVAPAHAVDVKAGNWDLTFTGNVNAYATYTRCGVANDTVVLAHACTKVDGAPNTFAIESGLLPSAFIFTAKTRAYDLDVSATVSFWPGLHVADTGTGPTNVGGTGTGTFSADMRQNFLTFGDASWGTIKIGKDLGLFGADAILSDMTLLGVGSGTAGTALNNHNVTLGHIGTGYIYADWIPQISYISPNFSGAQISVAVIEAFGMGYEGLGVGTNAMETPGVQAKLTYDLTGGLGRIWAGGMYQNTKSNVAPYPKLDTIAGELGVKLNIQGLQPMLYGYYGDGIGTAQIGLAATGGLNTAGDKIEGRTSYGWFAQLMYQIPNTKFRPGVSWGMSYLNQEPGDPDTLMHNNAMGTVDLFYQATDTLTLVAEYDHLRARNWAGGTAKSNSFALGAIMFF